MEFDINFVIPEEEEIFDKNEKGEEENQTHSGEKLHKCNQCDFASSQADDIRRRLKKHCGEKSNKCNQCEFASSQAGHLRRHMKSHNGEK